MWRTDKPTKQGKYLVTTETFIGGRSRYVELLWYGKPLMPNITGLKGWHWYYPDSDYGDLIMDDEVIAWQECPEPYEGVKK